MKMTAAVVEEFNKPLVLRELNIPALDCGQVLVRIYCSGICGAQLHHMAGIGTRKEFLPFLLGHEGGGEVVDIGRLVKHVKIGDRVVLHWRPGKGIESNFPKYTGETGSIVGGGLVTTFSDYAVVSENRVTTIPSDIPFDIAALMGCCITTGFGLINNEAQLKIGQSIAVFGCGGVGLSVIKGASMASGYPIIAIDIKNNKREQAEICGATNFVESEEVESFIKTKMYGVSEGIDVCVDTTGNPECIEKAYNLTKAGGKTILVGQPIPGLEFVFRNAFQHYKGKILMDSEGGKTDPSVDIARYINLYRAGKFTSGMFISPNSFWLRDVNEALDKLRSGSISGRAMMWMKT